MHGERVDIEPDGNGGLRLRRTGEAPSVRARYVVGCDGANSTVRSVLGLDMTDRAFFYDWLIVDAIFDEPRTFDPLNVQICDPARPPHLRVGRARAAPLGVHGAARRIDRPVQRRGHGLATPRTVGRQPEQRPPRAPRRLPVPGPLGTRNGGEAACCSPATPPTRHHPSLARACAPACATPPTWRGNSTGCSAAPRPTRSSTPTAPSEHQHGSRHRTRHRVGQDDLRLRRRSPRPRRDVPRRRRRQHHRDPAVPGISAGIILPGTPRAGELFVQADVERDGARGRFDDAVGAGWRLVTDGQVAVDGTPQWFASIGGAVFAVGGESGLTDVDGAYARWFTEHGVIAALQRPDFVLFGTAERPSGVDGLLQALQKRVTS